MRLRGWSYADFRFIWPAAAQFLTELQIAPEGAIWGGTRGPGTWHHLPIANLILPNYFCGSNSKRGPTRLGYQVQIAAGGRVFVFIGCQREWKTRLTSTEFTGRR